MKNQRARIGPITIPRAPALRRAVIKIWKGVIDDILKVAEAF
jgi:hypothetical protein